MKQSNNTSRREFLHQSAVLGAGAVLAQSSNLFAEKSSGLGNGPYPAEGMAGYSETGPLQFLKFQRRALGPKDVAIKITIVEFVILTFTRSTATGATSTIRKS